MTRLYAAPLTARTAALAASPRVAKALEHRPGAVPAVLTLPRRDSDGDFVVPDGGDWSRYPADPVVNWEHEVPVGTGEVELCRVTWKGEEITAPVGYTRFATSAACLKGLSLNRLDARGRVVGRWDVSECLDIAEQAAELVVARRIVDGVSLEFEPLAKERIGKSARLGRDAFRFDRWVGQGWAHTALPVNDDARLIDRAEKALSYAEGKAGALPDVIRKSLTRLAAPLLARPASARLTAAPPTSPPNPPEPTVAHVTKAMDDPGADGTAPPPADAPAQPVGSVAALTNFAQVLRDGCDALDAALAASDNPKVKKDAQKFCDDAQKLADKIAQYADKLASLLQSGAGDDPSPDADAPPADTDDSGAISLKSVPGWSPRRLKTTDFTPVRKAKADKPADPDAALKAENERLKAENAELHANAARLLALIP